MTAILLVLALLSPAPGKMERVEAARDGRGFVVVPSGKPFVPWGLNYGNAGRLIEDFWEADWPTIAGDFREMKDLGANVVRAHLQLGKFMAGPDRPNQQALDRLSRLVAEAEANGLYLDLTGLACYRTSDVPAWYDKLDEPGRWAVQARFWEAVAKQCGGSPAIFCYDLINEPLSPGDRRKPGEWYSGKPFGGYDFLQWISLDPAGRPREEIARQWIKTLTRAIRRHDSRRLITVGLLPSTPEWGHLSGFLPAKVAPELDFISVHIYPEKGKVALALTTLKGFAVGKPVVIEETFTLKCSGAELEEFLRRSRGIASGWMGHYDGQTIEQLDNLRISKKVTISQLLWLEWLTLFRKLGPEMKGERAQAGTAR
ncbi:MAG: cellulase family glycosylhydrolase [Isosphaeraceae bacterium]